MFEENEVNDIEEENKIFEANLSKFLVAFVSEGGILFFVIAAGLYFGRHFLSKWMPEEVTYCLVLISLFSAFICLFLLPFAVFKMKKLNKDDEAKT